MCGEVFPQSELQVDHIEEAGRLSDWSDLESFVRTLLGSTSDNYQLLCKNCHSIKSMAIRHGISLEEARRKKKIADFKKLSLCAMIEELENLGVEEKPKTKKRSVELYESFLKENK